MGHTIIEKILAKSSGESGVSPGDKVWADIDLAAMRDFGGPNVILAYEEAFGDRPVFDGDKVAITFDLHLPPRQIKEATNQKLCREFAKKQGVHIFDVNSGVGQHTLLEHGFVKPWDVVVGTDSHMNLLGALGAFASGVGTTDIVASMGYGKLWFKVPESIKIDVEGEMKKGTYAKDVTLHVLKDVGTDGALYKSVEFSGTTVESFDLSERITIASMVTEMSGKTSIIEPSQQILDFVKQRSGKEILPVSADEDAEYEKTFEFEISDLGPQVACPHSPDNVKGVEEVAGTHIDQSFIGSCTNGRYEDMKAAAEVLRGRKVSKDCRLIITPATMEVARQVAETGLAEILLNAGAVLTNPSCALCTIGHPGVLAEGDVTLSTSNRNFPGKIGKGGEIYLVSPATAAASAIHGKITDPREVLK